MKVIFSVLLGAAALTAQAQTGLSNAYRINLQSPDGYYISATRNFVPSLQANVEKPGMYEFFVLEDVNGGLLQSGDPVRIYAHSGYVTSNESNNVLLAGTHPDEMLEFRIERTDGPGAIRNHDKVHFTTADGAAIVQEGNGVLKVTNGTPLDITLSVADVSPAIAESFAQDWKAGWGITFDNSAQGIAGRKLQNASTLNALSGFRNNHAQASTSAPAAGTDQNSNVASQRSASPVAAAPAKPGKSAAPSKPIQVKTPPVTKAVPGLPSSLPLGYYKCYVDHVPNLAMAGYFTVKPGGKYIFHGFDANKRTGPEGSFTYDPKTGKINWLSGSWKTNNYYGIYSLDATYGDRIYLIPNGSDYSACKCFLQK